MKLHTVFITYNRLELTKRAIASYLETVTLPHTVIVMDNGSEQEMQQWLLDNYNPSYPSKTDGWGLVLLNENRYPGYACNRGFEHAPGDATHLHRADNDFEFLPGWCVTVQKAFRNQKLGQLGLRTNEEELFNYNNVGGNCIISRKLWDKGLRYDERPWPQIAEEVGTGWSEDGLFSPAVKEMGYMWSRVKHPCIRALANPEASDPYYVKSLGDRGVKL